MVKIRGTIKLNLCKFCKLDGKAVHNCRKHMPNEDQRGLSYGKDTKWEPEDDRPLWEDINGNYPKVNMAKKTTRKSVKSKTIGNVVTHSKPILIVVGESMVDPNDVSAIKKIRSKTDLYIIILKSQPNMEFPFWANAAEVAKLLEHFTLVE